MFLFSRKLSANLISPGLCELGRAVNVKDCSFSQVQARLYRGSSAVLDLDYSDPSSGGDCCLGDKVGGRKYSIRGFNGLPLVGIVVRVVKSLDWHAARKTRFREAVDEYGFSYAISAFRMMVHEFAFAQLRLEVDALLRDITCFYRDSGLDLFELPPFMMELLNHEGTEVFMVDALIMVFASESMLENAVDVFFGAKEVGFQPGILTCNFLLKCLAERKRSDYLFTVLDEMKNSGPSPTVYTYTILVNLWSNDHIAEKKVDMEKATFMFGEMESAGINPSIVTYGTFIRGFCLDGRPDVALEIMQDLRRCNKHLNAHCYNAVMHSLCKDGQLDEALRLFAEMKGCGISPDVYSYSILIEGYNGVGDIEKGLAVYNEMRSNGSNLKPSLVTYASLLKGLCNSRLSNSILISKSDCANELLEEMIKNDLTPSVADCSNLVQDYVRIALEILGEMKNQGINPDIFCYGMIMDRLCKEGKPELAMALVPLMLKGHVMPNVVVCCTLVHGFATQAKVDKAKMVYIGMIKLGVTPNLITHTVLLNILIASGQVEKAYYIFGQKISNGLTPDKIYYTSMIAGLCKIGDLKKANKVLKDMLKRGHWPSVVTYTCLIEAHCQENRMDLAVLLVDEMRTLDISPDVVVYTVLIKGYLRQGQIEHAHHLFMKMREEGINPDEIMWKILSRSEIW